MQIQSCIQYIHSWFACNRTGADYLLIRSPTYYQILSGRKYIYRNAFCNNRIEMSLAVTKLKSESQHCYCSLSWTRQDHPISSNSHPLATANIAIHCLKWGGGGVLQNKSKHHIILTQNEAVHPTAVSENYSSAGMLTILIKVQVVSSLSIIFAGKFTHI